MRFFPFKSVFFFLSTLVDQTIETCGVSVPVSLRRQRSPWQYSIKKTKETDESQWQRLYEVR